MVLAVDIGNSNIVIGGMRQNEMCFEKRFVTDILKTSSQYAIELNNLLLLNNINKIDIEGAIISSVVPTLTSALKDAIKKVIGIFPIVVGTNTQVGFPVLVDHPEKLGSDRLVDTVAAITHYSYPAIIFDMGTATTISVINNKGEYAGGCILPGMKLSLNALSNKASQLPTIDLEAPKHVIGKNTIECMLSGIINGNAAMIDGMIDRIEDELGYTATVIATGGLAHLVLPYCNHKIIYDRTLLLKGLYLLYTKNTGQ